MPLLDVNGQPVNVVDRGRATPCSSSTPSPCRPPCGTTRSRRSRRSHRCIAIDMPGFGQSPPPEAPGQASMRSWADLVVGVLDQLGVAQATVVGALDGRLPRPGAAAPPPRPGAPAGAGRQPGRSDDPAVAQRRTAQQDQLRDGTEVSSLAKETVEGLLSSGSMARPELVEYVHAWPATPTRGGGWTPWRP